uniref:RdRp n=1 Tax=Hubei partiti-like virus 3 TaxID=1923037 RepID=A0A1L3KLQ0_9VIRU|nr:RdRp [Hubei partiti-like virus 3]APG78255.1 RdRp [Hubei partiti-like virus 3]APG78292.1 RdRp [Hubei partiti-like virus 3]
MKTKVTDDLQDRSFFEPTFPGEGFAFNYLPSRIDRNALYALNKVFDPQLVAEVRTKYHRAKLTIGDLRSDLMGYSSFKGSRKHTTLYYSVMESVERDLFPEQDMKIIPWTHGSVACHPELPRQKSPGIPLKSQGYANKGEALDDPEVLRGIRKQWYSIEAGREVVLPDVACYARAQICTREKNKVRATWGYPLTVFLTEAQYFYPLIQYIKASKSRLMAYGLEMGNGGMQYLDTMVKSHKGGNIIIGDWSRFDKTVPAWLIRDAFRMLSRHIDWTQVETVKSGSKWPVKEQASKARWKKIVSYFIDTPIQLSNGERWIKRGGVPSGSCFTNLIDTIVNAIVMRYLVAEQTGELPLDDVYLGDDSVCLTTKPINLEVLSEQAKEQFYMVFNPDKSYQTSNPDNVHFLGYYNSRGDPRKPVDTIIASSIYPERPTRDKFETLTRLVGQAYSCFRPTDAMKFFKAARIMMEECVELEDSEVETYIRTHPHQFKYLSTLGIKVIKGITFPQFKDWEIVNCTVPRSPRKKWEFRKHDLDELRNYEYKWN